MNHNHLARMLNQATEGDYMPDIDVPKMPYNCRYKGVPLSRVPKEFLLAEYRKGYFIDYPKCKEWVERNLL